MAYVMEVEKVDGNCFSNCSKMNWDYDSVHIMRGEKAANTELS